MAKETRETPKPPEDIAAEVDALVRPLADYLVEHSDKNLPVAHNAGRLLREAAAFITVVAQTPPPVEPELPPGETPEQQKKSKAQKMAPLYEKA